MDRENVIKGLHDARRYLEDKEWSDRGASPHIDAINDALALLKEQGSATIWKCDKCGAWITGTNVVRCFDCKHFQWGDPNDETIFCGLHGRCYRWNFYCADGKREERNV